MGDKSPKSVKKGADQKKSKAASTQGKKNASAAAKQDKK